MTAREKRTDRFPEYIWLRTNLIRYREKRGWSQSELANQMEKLDQSYVSYIERMQVNPTMEVLATIARSLEIDVADLLQPTLETPTERKSRLKVEERAEASRVRREARREEQRRQSAEPNEAEEAGAAPSGAGIAASEPGAVRRRSAAKGPSAVKRDQKTRGAR